MNYKNYIINEDELIIQAIEKINLNSSRCVLVVGKSDKIIGIISEGDILRGVLKGINTLSPAKNIMVPNFKFLKTSNFDKIHELILEGITLIPILNNDHKLKEIITSNDFLKKNFKKFKEF